MATTGLKQAGRNGFLTTPLPRTPLDGDGEPLALVHFDAVEGLSELFNYNVEAVSLNPNIDLNQIMGQPCTLSIKTFRGGLQTPDHRTFNGIVVAARSTGLAQGEFFGYRLTLRPWVWFLTRTTNCRIFQDKDVPTIVQKVFEASGFTDFELKLEGAFPKLDYCVQYRETDFNFISRLMEKEGIYYFFRHEPVPPGQASKHILVLANGSTAHLPIPNHRETPYSVVDEHSVGSGELITEWSATRQIRSGSYEFNDYNYETPKANMTAIEFGAETYTRSDMEIYEYPGNYKDADAGLRYAGIALEAEQAPDHRRFASGRAISLFAGGLTTLTQLPASPNDPPEARKRLPPPSEFQEYLVVRALHVYGTQDYRASSGSPQSEGFRGDYEFQAKGRPFRAPIITPKPRIYGIQTAKVVTKDKGSTEEIDVEKLSEIYVHFYWDRSQQEEHKEQRSVKLRCAQLWAGKKWGGQFIPRVGMEVLVEFLDGDPDRPIVTGCVYNDDHHPPWDLPAQKTISGIKSESSKGDQGCNYWNFEDKKGSEQINVHAQLDLNTVVNNNETRSTGNDLDTTVTHAETRTIGEKFEVPLGSPSRQTTIKMGDDQLDVETGQILHTAAMKIELKVGPSTFTIEPWGITLDAPMITIKATGPITINGLPVMIN